MQGTMPPSYIIDPAVDFHDGIEQWFQYTREHAGLDNMYLFDEYQIHAETKSASLTLDYQNSQLLLHEDMAEYTDYPITADIPITDSKTRYLSTFCASQDRVPSLSTVQFLMTYARQNHLPVCPRLFSTFLMQGIRDQKQCYYLQLFLPLSSLTNLHLI